MTVRRAPKCHACGKPPRGVEQVLQVDTDDGPVWFHLDCIDSVTIHDDEATPS